MARLVWLHADLLQSANDEIIKAERESWEPEPELIPNIQVYHYHNDHLGTPNELTNQDGEVVWLADYEAWGNTAKVVWREEKLGQLKVSSEELQPIRFQGQSFDVETGLHYNRFRYYDPDLGMFISRDPIGLMGGSNVFQYAPNPVGWVDPFGLSKCARVDDDGTLIIRNKFPKGSEESRQLEEFVEKWNDEIRNAGGSMTRQSVSRTTRREASNYARQEKINNPELYQNGEVAGHISDVGWGGSTQGPFMPLSNSVNSYIGGATQAVPVGTTYTSVKLE